MYFPVLWVVPPASKLSAGQPFHIQQATAQGTVAGSRTAYGLVFVSQLYNKLASCYSLHPFSFFHSHFSKESLFLAEQAMSAQMSYLTGLAGRGYVYRQQPMPVAQSFTNPPSALAE